MLYKKHSWCFYFHTTNLQQIMVLYYSLGMLTRNEMKGVHSGM